MMAQYGVWLSAAPIPGGRVFELPYRGGGLSMFVCLPDAVDGIPEIERTLDPAAWTLTPRAANVFLPRFRAAMKLDLAEVLDAMGVRRAFGDAADLSGITTTDPLSVSAVLHEARIDVDEEGTEAAAATAMAVRAAGLPEKVEELRVDRPFLFLIRAAGGEIVFLGRVADPR